MTHTSDMRAHWDKWKTVNNFFLFWSTIWERNLNYDQLENTLVNLTHRKNFHIVHINLFVFWFLKFFFSFLFSLLCLFSLSLIKSTIPNSTEFSCQLWHIHLMNIQMFGWCFAMRKFKRVWKPKNVGQI